MTVLNHTTAWCVECRAEHPARYERRGSEVWFHADCPRGFAPVRASDDADLFLAYRAAGTVGGAPAGAPPAFPHNNVIEITTACDFSCGYCYNRHRREGPPRHRPLAEIVTLARQARSEGAYQVTLSGGEPLLHPDFFRIVRAVRRLGLGVVVATNGLELGRDPAAALRLKRAGVAVASLKLDACSEAAHRRLYGADAREPQRAAFGHCAAAGLRMVGAAVVTPETVSEVGPVLSAMLRYAPRLGIGSFQSLWSHPRLAPEYRLAGGVSKEAMVKALCAAGAVPGLQPADFRPVPACPAMRLALHPDCGLLALLHVEAGRVTPARAVLDLDRLAGRMAHMRPGRRMGPATGLRLGLQMLRAARRGCAARVLRAAWGTLSGRGRSGFVILAVESLMDWTCQDEERTRRCGVVARTGDGAERRVCFGLACKEGR